MAEGKITKSCKRALMNDFMGKQELILFVDLLLKVE